MKTVALAVLLALSSMASAQAPAPPPPPMPAASDSKAKPAPAKPRRAIELSPAERQAIDERELKAVKPASVEEALQPKPAGDPDNVKSRAGFRATRRASSSSALPIGSAKSSSRLPVPRAAIR